MSEHKLDPYGSSQIVPISERIGDAIGELDGRIPELVSIIQKFKESYETSHTPEMQSRISLMISLFNTFVRDVRNFGDVLTGKTVEIYELPPELLIIEEVSPHDDAITRIVNEVTKMTEEAIKKERELVTKIATTTKISQEITTPLTELAKQRLNTVEANATKVIAMATQSIAKTIDAMMNAMRAIEQVTEMEKTILMELQLIEHKVGVGEFREFQSIEHKVDVGENVEEKKKDDDKYDDLIDKIKGKLKLTKDEKMEDDRFYNSLQPPYFKITLFARDEIVYPMPNEQYIKTELNFDSIIFEGSNMLNELCARGKLINVTLSIINSKQFICNFTVSYGHGTYHIVYFEKYHEFQRLLIDADITNIKLHETIYVDAYGTLLKTPYELQDESDTLLENINALSQSLQEIFNQNNYSISSNDPNNPIMSPRWEQLRENVKELQLFNNKIILKPIFELENIYYTSSQNNTWRIDIIIYDIMITIIYSSTKWIILPYQQISTNFTPINNIITYAQNNNIPYNPNRTMQYVKRIFSDYKIQNHTTIHDDFKPHEYPIFILQYHSPSHDYLTLEKIHAQSWKNILLKLNNLGFVFTLHSVYAAPSEYIYYYYFNATINGKPYCIAYTPTCTIIPNHYESTNNLLNAKLCDRFVTY